MNCYLKKLSLDITDMEYEMYKEIPNCENGAINNLNCNIDQFYKRVNDRLEEERILLNDKDTPRITYILYDDNYPIGEVMIRPVLNSYWYNMSGNIGYKIRPSKRNMGYGNEILRLALIESSNLGLSSVRIGCLNNNIYSKKIIIKNGGVLTDSDKFVSFYKISLEVK